MLESIIFYGMNVALVAFIVAYRYWPRRWWRDLSE